MRLLLHREDSAPNGKVAAALEAAGHVVVRCADRDDDPLPCRALHDERCPLDDRSGVDAVVIQRDGTRPREASDGWAVACALRAGLPFAVVTREDAADDPLTERASVVVRSAPELVQALPDLAERRLLALEGPASAEAARLLFEAGVAGEATAEIRRHGRDLHVALGVPADTPASLRPKIAVRVEQILRRREWWSQRIDVSVQAA